MWFTGSHHTTCLSVHTPARRSASRATPSTAVPPSDKAAAQSPRPSASVSPQHSPQLPHSPIPLL
eukprot:26068-Eustigmatos_ZCMA.PRE.1